jgi:hypothetical protein
LPDRRAGSRRHGYGRHDADAAVRPPNEVALEATLAEDIDDLTAAVWARGKVPRGCNQNGIADAHRRQLARTISVEHSAR